MRNRKKKQKLYMTGSEINVQLAMWNWTIKEAADRTGRSESTVKRYTNGGKGYEDGVPQRFIVDLYQARANQFKA